ncbi:ribonuclease HIII [Parageobacillus toebii]|uniref:ribonuclease HIII n=1 Tax=Parageobacillus toebii TaxID=153151 RepID=UPI002E23FB4D|nr:ribonuclease HIII [Parageobacillus toebii]MED4990884.1 ribonuclease HIII [Parageobacillus toebii]
MNKKNKYGLYQDIKGVLEREGFRVSVSKEIDYGLQFYVSFQGKEGLIRIYQSKKGTRIDLSQIKDNHLLHSLQNYLLPDNNTSRASNECSLSKDEPFILDSFDELIGIDESGKGDYFGPLVIAGVHVNKTLANTLKEIGVTDSKKLSDNHIKKIAPIIKKICFHSIVVVGNEKYNELHQKIGNLNKLLAWGHARVIENLLEKVNCQQVLSDQFGDKELIKNALFEKGKKIKLYQKTKAEENIAVAAASILARYEYVSRLEKMSRNYKLNFPKGASSITIKIAKDFLNKYGEQELKKVAKLHFKTTEQLKDTTGD